MFSFCEGLSSAVSWSINFFLFCIIPSRSTATVRGLHCSTVLRDCLHNVRRRVLASKPIPKALYTLYRSLTYGSARICWQTDSLKIPTLNQGEEIRSKASDQDGGADLDSHFDVLFLGRHCEISGCHERLLAVDKQAFGMEVRSHRGCHLESPRVIVHIWKSLAGPIIRHEPLGILCY